jgi:hypothetical protein
MATAEGAADGPCSGAAALEISGLFGGNSRCGADARPQLHVRGTTKSAAREQRDMTAISHEVASFAQRIAPIADVALRTKIDRHDVTVDLRMRTFG